MKGKIKKILVNWLTSPQSEGYSEECKEKLLVELEEHDIPIDKEELANLLMARTKLNGNTVEAMNWIVDGSFQDLGVQTA